MSTDLFDEVVTTSAAVPLAARMRPASLDQFCGQSHLLAKGRVLFEAVASGHLHSMILWGPPGTGKTTLAKLLAKAADAEVEVLSAVTAGVKDIREVAERAKVRLSMSQKTVLFVDEVHRFSKSQQDAFLPLVEEGTIIFIGATTENPSFEVNQALLSRIRVHVLKPLSDEDLHGIVDQALTDERGLSDIVIELSAENKSKLIQYAGGDARRLLNALELLADIAEEVDGKRVIDLAAMSHVLGQNMLAFDKGGEHFYDMISALHKSVRGSNPDAALFWMAHMLVGGCDPLYIARRLVRMASEDIGNADPRALTLCLNAWDVFERLGSPEGELALAQAVVYCACAAKSNAVELAYMDAMADARIHHLVEVPVHLRNAPTKLMKELGYGKEYRYAHNEPHAYAAGEQYFPDGAERSYYQPTDRGLEKQIAEKLAFLQQLDLQAEG